MIVKINEHNIKFGFGLYFLGKAQKERNVDLNGLLSSLIKNPIADAVDLMYYSAKCEAELDDVKLQISKRDLLDYLEETNDFDNTDGLLAKWMNAFRETIRGNFLPKDENEEDSGDVKKK